MTVELTQKQKNNCLIGIILGLLLAALDSTIVGTAMPKIVTSLGGMQNYTWVSTVYLLCSTTAMPIFGKLADLYGRKLFYILGIGVFLMGSMLCGLANTMMLLIIFRAVQGIGAGMLLANAFALIGDIFPPAERGKYQGILSAAYGLASVIGPFAGGIITDSLNWRWVFYVNIPFGIISLIYIFKFIPKAKIDKENINIDYLGVFTLILCIFPMLLAFSLAGRQYEWASVQIIGLLSASAVMLAIFIFVELRAKDPVIPMNLFKNSIFNISISARFLSNAGMFTAVLFIPLFVQKVMGASATNSGAVTAPMMVALVLASVISGRRISKSGKYKIPAILGFLVMVVGMYMSSRMGVDTKKLITTLNMVIIGFGLGMTMPIFVMVVQNAFPHKQLGVVTSVVQFFGNLGGIIGMAIMGSILNNRFASEFSGVITTMSKQNKGAIPQNISDTLSDGNIQKIFESIAETGASIKTNPLMAKVFEQMSAGLKQALAVSISYVFLFGTIVTVLALILCFFLKEIPLRKSNDEKVEQ